MANYAFRELGAPFPRQRELFDLALRPSPGIVKQIDVCCGLGWSKTTSAIQIAALLLNSDKRQRILFLEPDWSRVKKIFRPEWLRIIPPALYTESKSEQKITWYNGAVLYYMPRVLTGDAELRKDRARGVEVSVVIDDETAIGFDLQQYHNQLARVRRYADVMMYLTLSTPKVGAYGNYLKSPGHTLFRGRTIDNTYLPVGYEARLRAEMGERQAQRELDAELVALEGRIWSEADIYTPWPQGNLDYEHRRFNRSEPWWLFCDLGSSTGAYVVVQRRRLSNGDNVWVAVADYCPDYDANATRAFLLFDEHYGRPAGVVAGADISKHSDVDGRTVAYFANQLWPGVPVHPCDEAVYDRQIQFNKLDYLIRGSDGQRRFTVAADYVSHDKQSKRGVKEMLQEDHFPPVDKRNDREFLPKGKQYPLCHVRDALLMGAVQIMCPPRWHKINERPYFEPNHLV